MKKLLALFLCLAMLVSLFPMAYAVDATDVPDPTVGDAAPGVPAVRRVE